MESFDKESFDVEHFDKESFDKEYFDVEYFAELSLIGLSISRFLRESEGWEHLRLVPLLVPLWVQGQRLNPAWVRKLPEWTLQEE